MLDLNLARAAKRSFCSGPHIESGARWDKGLAGRGRRPGAGQGRVQLGSERQVGAGRGRLGQAGAGAGRGHLTCFIMECRATAGKLNLRSIIHRTWQVLAVGGGGNGPGEPCGAHVPGRAARALAGPPHSLAGVGEDDNRPVLVFILELLHEVDQVGVLDLLGHQQVALVQLLHGAHTAGGTRRSVSSPCLSARRASPLL